MSTSPGTRGVAARQARRGAWDGTTLRASEGTSPARAGSTDLLLQTAREETPGVFSPMLLLLR